jgi:hypothetical protein
MNDTTTQDTNSPAEEPINLADIGIQEMAQLAGSRFTAQQILDEVERRIKNRERKGKKQIPHVVEFRNTIAKSLGVAEIPVPKYTVNDRIDTAFPSTEEEVAEAIIVRKMDATKVISALTKLVAGQ